MKKISIVVLDSDRQAATKALRHLGVVHLQDVRGHGAALAVVQEQFDKTAAAIALLSEFKVSSDVLVNMNISDEQILSKVDETLRLVDRKKACIDAIASNTAELDRFAKWGDLNPADLDALAEKGIFLSLYEIPGEKYFDLPKSIETIQVGTDKTTSRFLLVGTADRNRPADLPQEAVAVNLPRADTVSLRSEVAELSAEIADIQVKLEGLAALSPEARALHKRLAKEVEFENVASGMNAADVDALAYLTGFIPAEDATALKVASEREHWGVAISDPDEEDAVPTKLKNSGLVSLIYPLTGFLETVPGYREYDISGWFLLFFCIFFGMIFGDAAYGGILAIIALIGIAKTSGRGVPAAFKMMLLLALSNIVWGVLTCTWFGLDPAVLPDFFTRIDLDAISGANSDKDFVSQNLQVFCFGLALLQLTIAHLKVIGRFLKTPGLRPRVLADIGSIAMLFGMFALILFLVVSPERFPFFVVENGVLHRVGMIALYLIGGGFALSFVFANYEGSIGKSILASCANIITVILGLTNVFSDIMSYIRLWAVGLAGASISGTVNTMAGPLLGNFLLFLGVILLVFGHGLNLILNVLSVLVHGVRLNTLEFSSHLGVSWSGFAYKPFTEAAK